MLIRKTTATFVVMVTVASVGACSSSATPAASPAPSTPPTAKNTITTTSIPPTVSANSTVPTTPPAPTFTLAALKSTLLQPADLGAAWTAQTDPALLKGTIYGWGCAPSPHQIGSTPTAMSAAKTGDGSDAARFYYERVFLFSDAASAAAAQAALESAPQSCVGTHHVAAKGTQVGHTDTDDIKAEAAGSFNGKVLHELIRNDSNRGVNELLSVEARSGTALVIINYTMYHSIDKTSYRQAFTDESSHFTSTALTRMSGAATS